MISKVRSMSLDCHVRSTMQVGNPVSRALFFGIACLGFEAAHVWSDNIGCIHVNWIIPLPPSLMPRPHPCGEEKGSGYNTTSHQTLEGRNQHAIVNDHVLTYAIYGILSMPRGTALRSLLL